MRWTAPHRYPNIRDTIDRYHLYDRTLTLLRAKMNGAGSPCTYWRNKAITFYGTLDENMTKCYCWKKSEETDSGTTEVKSSPNRDHFLCMGTGVLEGYQKYGYHEIVFSTPRIFTTTSNSLGKGRDDNGEEDRFVLSGTSQEESLETENFELIDFKEVDYFLANDKVKKDTNRLKYFYSIDDGSTWTELSMIDYTLTKLGTKQAENFNLSEGITHIKFKVTFQKRYSDSSSPLLNSLRFRYRKHPTLVNMDPRFNIDIPAFLAAREQIIMEITQGEYGWKTRRPTRWWTLPEAHIKNNDIIMFLQGEFENQKYEVTELTEHSHGPELRILHRSFESSFLRDKYDIIRILDYLI